MRRASSSESIGSFALNCKNYKYKPRDNIGGNGTDTFSDIKGADLIWVNKKIDSIKIALLTIFVGLSWGKKSTEIGDFNLCHHIM